MCYMKKKILFLDCLKNILAYDNVQKFFTTSEEGELSLNTAEPNVLVVAETFKLTEDAIKLQTLLLSLRICIYSMVMPIEDLQTIQFILFADKASVEENKVDVAEAEDLVYQLKNLLSDSIPSVEDIAYFFKFLEINLSIEE